MIDKITGRGWWFIQPLVFLVFLKIKEMGLKVPSLYSKLGFPGNQPHPWVLSKSHLITINPIVERGLLWIAWHPCHPWGSEVISGTEEKRPNTVRKDAPLLLFQEILRVLGAVSQGKRPNVYEKYTLVIWMTKYIFLIIHNITVTIFSPVMRF